MPVNAHSAEVPTDVPLRPMPLPANAGVIRRNSHPSCSNKSPRKRLVKPVSVPNVSRDIGKPENNQTRHCKTNNRQAKTTNGFREQNKYARLPPSRQSQKTWLQVGMCCCTPSWSWPPKSKELTTHLVNKGHENSFIKPW